MSPMTAICPLFACRERSLPFIRIARLFDRSLVQIGHHLSPLDSVKFTVRFKPIFLPEDTKFENRFLPLLSRIQQRLHCTLLGASTVLICIVLEGIDCPYAYSYHQGRTVHAARTYYWSTCPGAGAAMNFNKVQGLGYCQSRPGTEAVF
jgi:hypothetical protein